jgi:nitrate reductase NapE component
MFEKHCFWWVVAGAILVLIGVGLYPIVRLAGSVALVGGLIFFIIWLITCIDQFDEWMDELFKEEDR